MQVSAHSHIYHHVARLFLELASHQHLTTAFITIVRAIRDVAYKAGLIAHSSSPMLKLSQKFKINWPTVYPHIYKHADHAAYDMCKNRPHPGTYDAAQ